MNAYQTIYNMGVLLFMLVRMMGVFVMVLPRMHCSMQLIVTIVEIHMLVHDVCVCLNSSRVKIFICITWKTFIYYNHQIYTFIACCSFIELI